jgi:hypothetical protein
MEKELLQYLLPKDLIDNFELLSITEESKTQEKGAHILVKLKEKNIYYPPEGENPQDYEAKGVTSEITIQDFPLRGKAVYINIQRRSWRHKETKKIVRNQYNFKADGVKLSKELSDFLKGRD